MKYSFHPDAEKELEEVENYYDNINQELGNRFRAETEMAISRILDFPNAWPKHPPPCIENFSLRYCLPSEDWRDSNISGDASSS